MVLKSHDKNNCEKLTELQSVPASIDITSLKTISHKNWQVNTNTIFVQGTELQK